MGEISYNATFGGHEITRSAAWRDTATDQGASPMHRHTVLGP
jgi:hypothetical protein